MATVTDVLNVARSQIGTTESPRGSNIQPYGAAYGMNGVAWCSIFVWWVFRQVGVDLKREVSGGYSDCDTALDGYRRRGWVVPRRDARPGDVVFYDMSKVDGSGADHTGIIESVVRVGVIAIEGNTSDRGSQTNGGAVLRKTRSWAAVKAVCRVPLVATAPTPAKPTTPPPPPGHTPTTEDEMAKYITNGQTIARVTDTTIRPYANQQQYDLDRWEDARLGRDTTVETVSAAGWALWLQNRAVIGQNP